MRSEGPRGWLIPAAPHFFFCQLSEVCALAPGLSLWFCLVRAHMLPWASELAQAGTWDENPACYLVKLLPLVFLVWVKMLLFLLTLIPLFFSFYSDEWSQGRAHLLKQIPGVNACGVNYRFISVTACEENLLQSGQTLTRYPHCQGCTRCFHAGIIWVALALRFPFPSCLSWCVVSQFLGRGSVAESRLQFILPIPDSRAWRKRVSPRRVCSCLPKALPSCSGDRNRANQANPGACATWMPLCKECCNLPSPPSG